MRIDDWKMEDESVLNNLHMKLKGREQTNGGLSSAKVRSIGVSDASELDGYQTFAAETSR